MKIFIACSKHFYDRIPEVQKYLEKAGHKIALPNSYNEPLKEEEMKKLSKEEHIRWKSEMLKRDKENIEPNDAVLVLNYQKNGQPNYIGGATFLEIFRAWELGKKVYLVNSIPENIFKDELIGINPTVLNGRLELIV